MDSPFTMVVLIVAISVGAGVFNNWIKMRQSGVRNAGQDREIDTLKSEVADLRTRVRTLEKLATDDETLLKREFDNLG